MFMRKKTTSSWKQAEDADTYLPKTFWAWWPHKAAGFVPSVIKAPSPQGSTFIKPVQLEVLRKHIPGAPLRKMELRSVYELQSEEHVWLISLSIQHLYILYIQEKFPFQVICLIWIPPCPATWCRECESLGAAPFWFPGRHSQSSKTS